MQSQHSLNISHRRFFSLALAGDNDLQALGDKTISFAPSCCGKWSLHDLILSQAIAFRASRTLDRCRQRITERFRRRNFGHMGAEIVIDDPQKYTKQFTIKLNLRLISDTDVTEKICENERDLRHLGLK